MFFYTIKDACTSLFQYIALMLFLILDHIVDKQTLVIQLI